MKKLLIFLIFSSFTEGYKSQCLSNLKVNIPLESVVGIGESSHGNKQDWVFRMQFIEENYSKDNELNVFIEMPPYVGENYKLFLDREIDSHVFYKSLQLFGLKTTDFLIFLDFINKNSKINLIGIDIQDYKSTIIHLFHKTKKEPLLILDKLYKKVIENETVTINEIDSLIFEIENRNIKNNVSETNYLKQYSLYKNSNFINEFKEDEFRDSCMAINFLKQEIKPNSNRLILASNFHILTDGRSMGTIIKNSLKEKYITIITQFYEGEILAVNIENNKWSVRNKYIQSPKKTLPHILKKKKYDNCLFETKLTFKKNKKLMIQDLGAGSELKLKYSGYHIANLKDINYVFFTIKSSPSKYIIK